MADHSSNLEIIYNAMFKKITNYIFNMRKSINSYDHILIACFQKSGSTYLSSLLCEITGYQLVGLNQFGEHNEQDICKYKLLESKYKNTITQQHVKGTHNNIEQLRSYNIKPIILTRNIYDVVISLHDHIEREDHMMPTGYIHNEYFNMSYKDKLMYLIKIHLPWYLNFYISWVEASKKIPITWVTYESIFNDQLIEVYKILEFYGLKIDSEIVLNSIQKMNNIDTRFNVGISGRGDGLDTLHKMEIKKIAQCWHVEPSVMQKIGLQ